MVRRIGNGYYGIVSNVVVENQQLRDTVAEAFRFAKSLPVEEIRADIPSTVTVDPLAGKEATSAASEIEAEPSEKPKTLVAGSHS